MSHKDLLILAFCVVGVQQQFPAALAGDQKAPAEPIMLADLSYGPYRSDVTPISSLGKSDNLHEFATKLKLIIAQSDFEKNYGSYGQHPIAICNLDKSEDPHAFEAELNKIVALSDFEKHLVNKNTSSLPINKNPKPNNLTVTSLDGCHRVMPINYGYSADVQELPSLALPGPTNIFEDMKLHPTKYLSPY